MHSHHHHHRPPPSPPSSSTASRPDYTAANIAHFASLAATYDSHPLKVELARKSAKAMRRMRPFFAGPEADGAEEEEENSEHEERAEGGEGLVVEGEQERGTAVLDFACGTGLLSQHLAPHVRSIVGVDTSAEMVEVYNAKVSNQGIDPSEMKAVCLDIEKEDRDGRWGSILDGRKFDVVVCAQSFHHLPSPHVTVRLLARLLRPGGSILIVDIFRGPDAHLFHNHAGKHVISYPGGFIEEEMREIMLGGVSGGGEEDGVESPSTGLTNFEFDPRAVDVPKGDRTFFLFCAKAVLPRT